MVKRRFKYEAGAATQFVSRRRARKKLQISLADFRRLCILKGIYPHEPKNKKQVNKGSTAPRTFYFKKDIDFIAHEPIIDKFRQHKATIKKLKRAKGRLEYANAERIRGTMDDYTVDHIVLERYPNFIDAVRDLDDALTLVFLFASFPQSRKVHADMIGLCKRLKVEFLNYLISTNSIKKTFISIKGIYIQAEIHGEKVTFIMPHSHAYEPPQDIDFRVMSTFADFYTVLVGFTMFQLYKRADLVYPPRVALESEGDILTEASERLGNLLGDLVKEVTPVEEEGEEVVDEGLDEDLKERRDKDEQLKNLFGDKVFYFNREVPKQVLTVLVRSLNGKVVLDEDDDTITHHIIDRNSSTNLKHSAKRSYLQPQYVFDCINANLILPVNRYLPCAELPAHLSPFTTEKEGGYRPPERVEIEAMQRGEDPGIIFGAAPDQEDPDEDAASNADDDDVPEIQKDIFIGKDDSDSSDAGESGDEEVEKPVKEAESEKLIGGRKRVDKKVVAKGKKDQPKGKHLEQDASEEKRLAVSAMPKKIKRLHDRIQHGKKTEKRKTEKLTQKRKVHEEKRATRSSSRKKQKPN